jgi:hypothetical protein
VVVIFVIVDKADVRDTLQEHHLACGEDPAE